LGIHTIFRLSRDQRAGWNIRRAPTLLVLILLFLGWGALRMLAEIKQEPVQVLRNSAFVWYCSFPLFLLFSGLRAKQIENVLRLVAWVFFSFFCYYLARAFLGSRLDYLTSHWFPEYGWGYVLFFALTGVYWGRGLTILSILGLAFGFSLTNQVQRTSILSLLTCFVVTVGIMYGQKMPWPRVTRGLAFFLAIPLGFALFSFQMNRQLAPIPQANLPIDSNPFKKSAGGNLGVEGFREYMWRDAISIVRQNPLMGVGFRRQVVERVYAGGGLFLANDGDYEYYGSPPISGPHNSYLNAAARLGLLAGLLLLAIHLLSLYELYLARCWAALFFLLGQMIYAFFNVGLEGPIRSFAILACIGTALIAAAARTGMIPHPEET
jgi:O-antigen ligase